MSKFKKLIFCVILVCLVSIINFLSNGYCDDWVYVGSHKNGNYSMYYKPSSVIINKQNKTIIVWSKTVFTEQGKIDFLKKWHSKDNYKFDDINHQLILYFIDYNELQVSIDHIIYYNKSGNVLLNSTFTQHNWKNIIPDSLGGGILNKLIEDYNIQR
jgi:hypothetical protein